MAVKSDHNFWPLLGMLPRPVDFKSEVALQGVPAVSGIYCLWTLIGDLVYIGQSSHIANRLTTHRREGKKDFHSATFYPIADYSTRLRLEGVLILLSNPLYNRAVTIGIAADGRCWDTTRKTFKGRPVPKTRGKSGYKTRLAKRTSSN